MRRIGSLARSLRRSAGPLGWRPVAPLVHGLPAGRQPCPVAPHLAGPPATQQRWLSGDNGQGFQLQASGLQLQDLVVGGGATAAVGNMVHVHYTGRLADGTEFDSSVPRGEPIQFLLGRGMVIPGWDEGILGMQVGGKRQLIIPPHLGYGQQGIGPIPPNAELHFECELVEVDA
uniref:peptidylprolyl isomerase n=1 Tax=Rhizochromulina marina TaxID=1034831 RepID=A0A7S2SW96_9STRA|mmetsp:Transcript_9141/g.26089  ORF Transcript_9141/g.26089 Transcript_9141/m.26089 type:complete len:174 (+) Transcript_9141:29-550(+)